MHVWEICQRIEETTHIQVSGSTVCRILRKNGYTRNKIQQAARQRSVEYRAAFMAQVLQYDQEYFVWVDKTGSDAKIIFTSLAMLYIGKLQSIIGL